MTTAKPIQRPTHTGSAGNGTNHDSDRGGPGTGQRTRTKRFDLSSRDHKKQHSLPSNEKPPQDETQPNKDWKNVPRSPVSTGRLHPSRGFHLRPIKHVFRMRATDAPKSAKES